MPVLPIVAALAASILVAACGPSGQTPPAKGPSFPPAPVSVAVVAAADLGLSFEYAGQTMGSREVEIRARVTGILQKRNYTEGAPVRAGQSLFSIDPAPFETARMRAEADIAGVEARLAQAERQAARLGPLVAARAVSQKELDDAQSTAQIARADLKAAQARLAEARLNIGYARVESPLAGIAGRAQRSEGALVSGPDVLLTTVVQVDPIYASFGWPDADQERLRREVATGAVRLPADGRLVVQVRMADGSLHPHSAKLDFADVRVNPATGTSEARATLANPGRTLKPGQFVRVIVSGPVRVGALAVPQRAVLEGPQGKFVYVVGAGEKGGEVAQLRGIEVGEWTGSAWVVRKGLAAGERVITDGVMKIGPGAPVNTAAAAAPDKPAPGAQDKPAPGAQDKPAAGAQDKPAAGAPDKPAAGAPDKPAAGAPDKPAPGVSDKSGPGTPDKAGPGTPAKPAAGVPDKK
jgi:membrane fusion protein (multidrug efflux system)